jgi:hypothetical protein
MSDEPIGIVLKLNRLHENIEDPDSTVNGWQYYVDRIRDDKQFNIPKKAKKKRGMQRNSYQHTQKNDWLLLYDPIKKLPRQNSWVDF